MSIAMEVTMTLMTLTVRLTLANSCELSVVGVSLIGKRQRVCCWMHGVFAGDLLVRMKVSQVRGWSKKTKESGAVPVEEPRVILFNFGIYKDEDERVVGSNTIGKVTFTKLRLRLNPWL